MTRWVLATATIGTLTGCALVLGRAGAIGVAVTAASILAIYGIRAVRRDREKWMRRGREEVWQRRLRETPGAVRGGKDPDWLFNAPYWQLPEEWKR